MPAVVRVGLALVPTDWSVLDLGLRTPLWVDWPVWRPDLYAGCEPCSGLSALIDLQTWHQPSPGGVAACFDFGPWCVSRLSAAGGGMQPSVSCCALSAMDNWCSLLSPLGGGGYSLSQGPWESFLDLWSLHIFDIWARVARRLRGSVEM